MNDELIKDKNMQKYNLQVEGMTCASCVARVEKAIKKVEGVDNVSVNFATEKASFELDPEKVDIKEIEKIVEDAGYKIQVPEKKEIISTATKDEPVETESNYYKELKKDLLFAIVLTLPVFAVSMSMEFSWFHKVFPISMDYINKILFLLTTPIVFISGKRFFTIFWNNLKHFAADMNSLVAIGTGAAYAYSTTATLFPELLSKAGIPPHVYFDSTAVIITLILLGRFLENRAKQKTGSATTGETNGTAAASEREEHNENLRQRPILPSSGRYANKEKEPNLA